MDGRLNGKCSLLCTNGTIYEGEYRNGKLNGLGKERYIYRERERDDMSCVRTIWSIYNLSFIL